MADTLEKLSKDERGYSETMPPHGRCKFCKYREEVVGSKRMLCNITFGTVSPEGGCYDYRLDRVLLLKALMIRGKNKTD